MIKGYVALASLIGVLWFGLDAAHATVTGFTIMAGVIIKPGEIDRSGSDPELIDVKVKGFASVVVDALENTDKGRIIALTGTVHDNGDDSLCGSTSSTVTSCATSAALHDEGQQLGCTTQQVTDDCDDYYQTEAKLTFFFADFKTKSNCANIPCACT